MQKLIHRVRSPRSPHSGVITVIGEHICTLLLFMALSIAVSWPLVHYFTTHLAGISFDPLHNLWILWHTQQALLGEQPWFYAPLLYYPDGISLLIHGLGPVMGIFALPFWPWGPEAAHNGAILVGLCLTGYCMYLLARGLGFDYWIALFAGVSLLMAPMCLAGLYGHMTKVFLGGLPLLLLALLYALNPKRSRWWTITPALALLVLLLHSGYQFVFGGFALGFFLVLAMITTKRVEYRVVIKRIVLLCVSIMIFVGPLIGTIMVTANDPAYKIAAREQISKYQPDLLQLVVPNSFSRIFGEMTLQLMAEHNLQFSVEKTVTLYVTMTLLCLLAAIGNRRGAWRWLLFTFVCVLLALGSTLQFQGRNSFTANDITIPLPFSLISALPGFGFVRAPGRFMMVGFVGFGIAASYGLAWLTQRWPKQRYAIVFMATILMLVESWPQPFPKQALPAVPDFYREIATDSEEYGVLDLPIKPSPATWYVGYSAIFQIHQMVHHKGIFAGYTSRSYANHPALPMFVHTYGTLQDDVLVDNTVIRPFMHAQMELAEQNYRYVVWHKQPYLLNPDPDWNQQAAQSFVSAAFEGQPPLIDDGLVQVYQINPLADLTDAITTTTVALAKNWYAQESEWRWAKSPTILQILSPEPQPALLEITPAFIYDPQLAEWPHRGERGVLEVESGDFTTALPIATNTPAVVPLSLAEGRQVITLTLQAGNYDPSTYGFADSRQLSFAVRSIHLHTAKTMDLPDDIQVTGQSSEQEQMIARYGANWYQRELTGGGWRWSQSPSELLIYSQNDRQVQLQITPAMLYKPGEANGLGNQGIMQVTTNGTQPPQQVSMRVAQPSMIDIPLHTGWNTITLALESGNFQPSDVISGHHDKRLLSFALRSIEIIPK